MRYLHKAVIVHMIGKQMVNFLKSYLCTLYILLFLLYVLWVSYFLVRLSIKKIEHQKIFPLGEGNCLHGQLDCRYLPHLSAVSVSWHCPEQPIYLTGTRLSLVYQYQLQFLWQLNFLSRYIEKWVVLQPIRIWRNDLVRGRKIMWHPFGC